MLYKYVDSGTLYVALVVDGNKNDNAFDALPTTDYLKSAGWPVQGNTRPAYHLINSELATFTATICGVSYDWDQGYARQVDATGTEVDVKDSDNIQAIWVSNNTTGKGTGTAPAGYQSSSSYVWNMNHYAEATPKTFNMNVNCGATMPCTVYDWKSPFHSLTPNVVTNTGGFPEVISTTTPISHSFEFDWEWAMVYEWSVPLECLDGSFETDPVVTAPYSHHSPPKSGLPDDPTPVTLTALAASTSAALLPIAGLLVGVSSVIVAPRRRRRRDQ